MPTGAGNSRGSTGSSGLTALSMLARQMSGVPQEGAVSTPGGSTNSGLDIEQLLAAVKSGQVSAGSLMQLLALLMGQGMNPQGGGDMSAIQNAGQGGPAGGRGSQMGPGGGGPLGGGAGGPIAQAFMGQ